MAGRVITGGAAVLQGRSLGIIVNPVAGMGGAVGLKGTDGADALAEAFRRGAKPCARDRARAFVSGLSALRAAVTFVTCRGAMGEDALPDGGYRTMVLGIGGGETGAGETREAARAMEAMGVQLIAFCGGDGTARDVMDAVGERVPALGIPAGVKMHSGVFAATPEAAAGIAMRFLWDELPLRRGEVADVDEEAFREGRVSSRLYGYLSVPNEPSWMQGMKVATPPTAESEWSRQAIAKWVVENMHRGTVYLLGPGSTVKAINEALGIDGSLLGVDVVLNGKLVRKDATEGEAMAAIAGREARIIVSPIGKQGFIFGRGNQQISGRVLRALGKGAVTVLSTREKLEGIDAIRADTGDRAVNGWFKGGVRVLVDYNTFIMKRSEC